MNRQNWLRITAWITVLALTVLAGCSSGGQKSEPVKEPQAEGKTLSITLDGTQDRASELEAVANYLRQIGINAEVRIWEKAALNAEVQKGARTAYTQDWGSSTFDPYDLAVPKLKTGDRGNYSFYSNPAVDRLLEEGAFGTNEAVRRQAYESAQELLQQEAPWIFGYYMDVTEATTADVQGFTPAMDSRINLHDVSRTGADSLVVGLRTDRLQSLDPANHRDRETETVIRNIYDGLVTRTPTGEVVPELAESWMQPDPTTYVFKLKQGVKFHDGSEMTADDVVFTFNRILAKDGIDGKQSPRVGLLGPVKSVEKTGDYEVKFTLERPFPVWLQLIVHTQIVSRAHVEKMGSSQKLSENPMGTGPFKFVRGKLDSEVVLERFDQYHGGAAKLPPVGPAKLKTATFRMIPEPSTRVAALKAGEVHIIQDVPVDQIAALSKDAKISIKTTEGTRLYMIELNNKILTDPKVRLALNYAIDWDTITKEIYGGRAHRVPTAMLPSGFGFHEGLKPYPYDPAKAKQLLQEAGYKTE
ncbi:MAG: ABC transporter substrate-binding protein [Bacillota bacterium]